MCNKATEDQKSTFLREFKALIIAGKLSFIPRRKNLVSLAYYGLTIPDVKDILLELTTSDYYKGPKQDFDRNRPGDIWEFKRKVDETRFYIKLKIDQNGNQKMAKCLAFHEDEYPDNDHI